MRWAIAAAILLVALLTLPRFEKEAEAATLAVAVRTALEKVDARLPAERPDLRGEFPARLVLEGKEAKDAERIVRDAARALDHIEIRGGGRPLTVILQKRDGGAWWVGAAYDEASAAPVLEELVQQPVRPWSVLPPLVAIVLAFATGRLILSLSLAILLGAILSVGANPFAFLPHAVVEYAWKATFTDPFKIWIFVFTTLLIGLVALATRAGGVQAVVERFAKVARGRRSTQLVSFLMGLAIFFDDYANTILVGSTMRPLTDRQRISREKLAWLVDSTSAPIAGVAIISTWIGYEVGLLGDLARSLGMGIDGYGLFFSALPFRFYCFFTLAFVALVIWSGRDFGPMLRAERRALERGELMRPGAAAHEAGAFRGTEPKEGVLHLARVAVVPIAVVLACTAIGLLYDGGGLERLVADPGAILGFSLWRDAFGAAENSTLVLALASLAGTLVLFAQVLGHRLLSFRESVVSFGKGMSSMWLAIAILTLAWAIKATCDDLHTAEFLVAGLRDAVAPAALPLAIFGLAAVVSFATGTSWGTMGILLPTAVPLAWHLGGMETTFLVAAAVLDGSIFGDHISPISDTSVMSSVASSCDLMDHVKTQLPYALTVLFFAAAFGYAWNALGLAYGLGWLLALVGMAGALFLFGRRLAAPAAPVPVASGAAEPRS